MENGALSSLLVRAFAVESLPQAVGHEVAERVAETLGYVPGLEVHFVAASASLGTAGSSGANPVETGTPELTGSRAGSGDRVVVSADVLDGSTGQSLWARDYDVTAGDRQGLTEDLSLAIAHDLRLALVPYVPKEYTRNRRSYDRFLRGVYAMRRNTSEDLWQALQFHREAYEEDRAFALAHAIAGNASLALVGRGVAPEVGFEHAREHVLAALTLDHGLAEGHAALGYLQIRWDRDFEAGEASLRRALMMYPTLPQAHDWYGDYLLYVRNRPDAAIAHVRRALEVDPLNTARSRGLETVLYRARRYEEVERQSAVTWSLDPEIASDLPSSPLGHAYREMGRYEESIAEFRALHDRVGGATLAGAAMAYGRMGRIDEALAIAQELEALPGGGPPLPLARIYANVGDRDRAFEWLEVGKERRPHSMLQIAADPALDPIRGDPRFAEVLERIGIGW